MNKQQPEKERIKVIRLPEVIERVGMSKPSIYRLMREEVFPNQIRVGIRAVGWIESEIDEWLEEARRIACEAGQC